MFSSNCLSTLSQSFLNAKIKYKARSVQMNRQNRNPFLTKSNEINEALYHLAYAVKF